MKKTQGIILILIGLLALSGNWVRAENLTGEQAAVYLRNGELVVDDIIDISSTRLVLQLKSGRNIPLSQIWMINFIDTGWDFPSERDLIQTAKPHLFLRNGSISVGNIIDFSIRRRIFQLDSGQNFKIGAVKRIYFSSNVPNQLAQQQQQQMTAFDPVGMYEGFMPIQQQTRPAAVLLIVGSGGTFEMDISLQDGQRPIIHRGEWKMKADGGIRLKFIRSDETVQMSGPEVINFNWVGNELVSTDPEVVPPLKLRKR